jgi:squalene-hopene/tetraprenyl-beta-curcumene cyclase
VLQPAAGLIAGAQLPDGSWRSRWHAGPYLPTYFCCQALRRLSPRSPALPRAAELLLASQRPDGGWGEGGESTPSAAAAALLALLESTTSDARPAEAIRSAIRYLLLVQREHGLWSPGPLLHTPLPGARTHVYRSATLTAALAGAALLGARQP